jgi:hypothetical protein
MQPSKEMSGEVLLLKVCLKYSKSQERELLEPGHHLFIAKE